MTPSISALSPFGADGPIRYLSPVGNAIPRVLTGLGFGLCLVIVAEWTVFAELQIHRILDPTNVAGLVTNTPFLVALVYSGHWLAASDLSQDRYPRIAGWCFGALACLMALNASIILTMRLDSLWFFVGWLRWAMVTGAGIGLFIGVVEARAIERERTAERATARAEFAESKREWFDYLNGLLRHEVLNTANVISGRASLLLETHELDESVRTHLETIDRQSEDMTDVIGDVRILLQATDGETQFEERTLAEILRTEIESFHDRYDGVRTELSVPDDLTVMADDLLPRLFSNLLANAVEHNTRPSPRVIVTSEATNDTVLVHVADNGPGIPAEKLDSLFERDRSRSDTHGLGLFIVSTLAERYGGSVRLNDTGPDGTTFTVELPRADVDLDGPPHDVVETPVSDAK